MNIESRPPFSVRADLRGCIEKRLEAFDKGYRQNIGLLGVAGLGKTYLLLSLFRSLQYQRRFLPVYLNAHVLDFDHFVECWTGALLSSVFISRDIELPRDFQSLLTAAHVHVPRTTDKIQALRKQFRREKGASSLKELFSLTTLLGQETGQKIILMIDEFQELERLPVADPFGLLGKQIMIEKNVLYLAASSRPGRAREILKEKLSLLFGNFETLELEPLDFQETAAFLENRLPMLELTSAQKRFIIRMTDGYTSYLEFLADSLEMFYTRDTHPDFVNADLRIPVSNEVLLKAFKQKLLFGRGRISLFFEKRIEELGKLAKDPSPFIRVMLALSDGKRKLAAISAYIERKTAETQKILQRLVQEDFLCRHGAFYTLDDPLFRFWLKYVYQASRHIYTPEASPAARMLDESLHREFERSEGEEQRDLSARMETLLKQFHNDSVEISQKKFYLPQFSEVIVRPPHARGMVPFYAKGAKSRWFCQVACQKVHEEDILLFLEDLKKYRKKSPHKVLLALGGIDQNAKLMAQEARIHLWTLRDFNALLDLYDLPKMITLAGKEEDAAALGALAQNIHSS